MLLFSFSCKKENQEAVYTYGTPEFSQKSISMKYNLNDAINLYCK